MARNGPISARGPPNVMTENRATVYFNGVVVWEPWVLYHSFCPIDVEWYPFDIQTCRVRSDQSRLKCEAGSKT